MSVDVDPKVLERALMAVKPAVGTRSAVEALSGVLLRVTDTAFYVEATNMTTSVRRLVPHQKVWKSTQGIVSHKQLHAAVKRFAKAGTLSISRECDEIVLEAGERSIRLRTLRAEDWPATNFDAGDRMFAANAQRLADVIDRASRFASRDDTRPLLTAQLLDLTNERVPRMIATDSYRLAVMPLHGVVYATGQRLAIPSDGLRMAIKGLKECAGGVIDVRADNQFAYLRLAYEDWRFRLIDGNYPQYEQLIPEAFEMVFDVESSALLEACATAAVVLNDRTPMRLSCNGTVEAIGTEPDRGSFREELNVRWQEKHTDEIVIGVNDGFVADIAKVAGERLTVKLISPLRPIVFTSADETFVQMPIRLNV